MNKLNKITHHSSMVPLPRTRMPYEQSLTYHRFTSVASFIFLTSHSFFYFFYLQPFVTLSLSSLASVLSFHLTFSCFNSSFSLIISSFFLLFFFTSFLDSISCHFFPSFISSLFNFPLFFLSCFCISFYRLPRVSLSFFKPRPKSL